MHSAERQEEQKSRPQHGQFSFDVKKLKRLPQAVHASPDDTHCARGTGYPCINDMVKDQLAAILEKQSFKNKKRFFETYVA